MAGREISTGESLCITEKSSYSSMIESKNDGLELRKRTNPTIKDYYVAASSDPTKPLTYQKGLSNYSSLILGDDRITFSKSLMSSTFTQESLRVDTMSILTDAHIRNETKTPKGRQHDYAEALNTVTLPRVLEIDAIIKNRLDTCTSHDVNLLHKAFKRWDRNVNGNLNIREFVYMLNELGLKFQEIETFAVFGIYDTVGDGVIHFPSFEKIVRPATPVSGRTLKFFDDSSIYQEDAESDEEADRAELSRMLNQGGRKSKRAQKESSK